MPSLPTAPAVLPMWQGRPGLIRTVICFVLGALLAVGLLLLTERSLIAPACRGYADAHAMRYTDFKLVGIKTSTTVVCLLARADGKPGEIYLREIVPPLTEFAVGWLVFLEVTAPGFAILLALAWTGWSRRALPR